MVNIPTTHNVDNDGIGSVCVEVSIPIDIGLVSIGIELGCVEVSLRWLCFRVEELLEDPGIWLPKSFAKEKYLA